MIKADSYDIEPTNQLEEDDMTLLLILLYCELILTDEQIVQIAELCSTYFFKTDGATIVSLFGTPFEEPIRDIKGNECIHFKLLVKNVKKLLGIEYDQIVKNLSVHGHLCLALGMAPSLRRESRRTCQSCKADQSFHRFCYKCGMLFNITDDIKETYKYEPVRNCPLLSYKEVDEEKAALRGNCFD